MVQRLPETYRIDAADPRAPSQEVWDRMSPEERDRVVAMLPIEVPIELQPPEGDHHRLAKTRTTDTLDAFFRRIGRKIYVSSELGVFYPDEPRFYPDVFAVLDVDPHPRTRWTVSAEGMGLDLVIEVHYGGDTVKDYELNVERYARLGIREYFHLRSRQARPPRLPAPATRGRRAQQRSRARLPPRPPAARPVPLGGARARSDNRERQAPLPAGHGRDPR
ncbi:MAG: Uma2 family endonuclease, partial [Byssovorax sp.]